MKQGEAALKIQKVWRGQRSRKNTPVWICESCSSMTFMLHSYSTLFVCVDCWEDFEDDMIQVND